MTTWTPHDRGNPCPKCSHADSWCCSSTDGRYAMCRRIEGEGAIVRTDRNGVEFYLYVSKGAPIDVDAEPKAETWREQPAAPEHRDRVYRALCAALPLSPGHLEALRTRGLPGDWIERAGYSTLPADDERDAAVRAVRKEAGAYLLQVPGFFKRNGSKTPRLAGMPGLLVPTRDVLGRIVACKIRADQPGDAGKYRWLSAPQDAIGCGPGSCAHVPLHEGLSTEVVRITEGPIKADVATAHSGVLTIGLPGVSAWRLALPVLAELGARRVLLAFDGDARRNRNVARSLARIAAELARGGYEVAIEVWPDDAGKGIDDVLAAGRGHDIEVHEGRDAWERIAKIHAGAGAGKAPEVEARAQLDGLLERIKDDPAAAFSQDVIEAASQLEEGTPEYERLFIGLKGAKVRVSAWTKQVRRERAGHHRAEQERKRAASPKSEKPYEVVIEADELKVADQCLPALARLPNIFQRGGALVGVVREPLKGRAIRRSVNAPRIVAMPRPRLRELLSHVVVFKAWKRRGRTEPTLVQITTPGEIVAAIHARGEWTDVRLLNGVVECPVLRADGSLLDVPGYDEQTGLIYEPNAEFPPVAKRPTPDDARQALAVLKDLVCDFPFAKPEHRSAWLALLLTPFARAAFDGCAPLGLVDKNVRGAGGTLLCKLIGTIYAGRDLACMSQADDQEMRKRITSIAMAGDPIILLDNIKGTLGGPALESAITTETWADRELGANRDLRFALRVLWLVSANNVALTGDLIRRALHIRLESEHERPEEREGFRYELPAHAYAERPRLVVAALTVLRAYFEAGCKDQRLKAWGSFESWGRVVRGALVWAGEPDPCEGRTELVESADTEVDVLLRLIIGWEGLDGPAVVPEAIVACKSNPEAHATLKNALAELCGGSFEKVTARRIGNAMRRFKGRVVGGRCLAHKPKVGAGVPWYVHTVSDSGASSDSVRHAPRAETTGGESKNGKGAQSHQSNQSHQDEDTESGAFEAAETWRAAETETPPEPPERRRAAATAWWETRL